jgi:gamma-glutamyl-gamma-aminobutyrate hydrolase PuuD
MRIGIVPSVINRYENQIEYAFDSNLEIFLEKVKKNNQYFLLFNKRKIKLDLIILCGGNTLYYKEKNYRNKLRENLDNFYLNYAIDKKIKLIGICHGSQFLAKKFGGKLKLNKNHVKKSHLILKKNFMIKIKKNFFVNSFHEYTIAKLNKNFEQTLFAVDETIEFFKIKKKNLFGMMWHPERNKKINSFDLKIFKKICSL